MSICEDRVEMWAKGGMLCLCVCMSGSCRYNGEVCAFLNLATGPHTSWDRTAAVALCPRHSVWFSISQDLGRGR